ncbi:protein spaetzle 5 isoform X1 [Vespa velutina]|uniref:protein spaetzle 5 isoform X1 n=1 Tax=Vespa velutina TaxID=202808 RepID=UPI001FB4962F|nr:protein spaetzle 5 isoform X1 [Vespa velutina]XP_047359056.1 protein spaetzle 5 isoform X1 [Vespa velutina]
MNRKMRIILADLFLFIFLAGTQGEPCTEYGCPGRPQYEPFVPAPPGHTPRCAKPGQTFCESLDHYPQQLIKFLVDKCSFDFSTALRDESHEDFNAYSSSPDYHQGYEYPRQDTPTLYSQPLPILPSHYPVGRQPTLLYGPPFNSTHHNGYKYAAPSRHERNPLLDVESSTKYHPQQHSEYPIFSQAPSLKSFKQDRTWWMNNGYVRSNKMAPQTFHENPLLQYVNLKTERTKRQMNTDTVALCPTEAQYITPKAALNNRGNWMYVVNLAEQDDKYSQLVKSEKCSTNTCNGLCSLPAGYTSTCQQQFVQKRLVALEGSGNRLYTDIFWFPHGCSCHVRFNGL